VHLSGVSSKFALNYQFCNVKFLLLQSKDTVVPVHIFISYGSVEL
jgi:hypothetical protein